MTFTCDICNKKLRGLELINGEVLVKASVRNKSNHYPYCRDCWIEFTDEGKAYNRQKVSKNYRANTPKIKRLNLRDVQAIAKIKNLTLRKLRQKVFTLVGEEINLRFNKLTEVLEYLEGESEDN